MEHEKHPAEPADRLERAVGRAIQRLSRTLEQAGDEPMGPGGLVRALGQLAILERLNAGVLVPPDVLEPFFAAKAPDDSPTVAGEELSAMLRRVLDGIATRLRARGVEVPDLGGPGAADVSADA